MIEKLKAKLAADFDLVDLLRLKTAIRVFCKSNVNLNAIKAYVRKVLDNIITLKLPIEWEDKEAMYMGETDLQVFTVP